MPQVVGLINVEVDMISLLSVSYVSISRISFPSSIFIVTNTRG